MSTKYRIKDHDPVNDIYILQEHLFLFLWKTISAGSKAKLEKFIKENK